MATKKKTAFDLLPKKEKRIVILKDALRHLNAERFKADTGSVMNFHQDPVCTSSELTSNQLQTIIKRRKRQCTVCQRGALLFSMVWRTNNFVVPSDVLSGWLPSFGRQQGQTPAIDSFLTKLFSEDQLKLMEAAFETDYHKGLDGVEDAYRFGR